MESHALPLLQNHAGPSARRGELTLDALCDEIQASGLSDYLKELALLRLRFAEEYIDDARRLSNALRRCTEPIHDDGEVLHRPFGAGGLCPSSRTAGTCTRRTHCFEKVTCVRGSFSFRSW